MAPGTYLVRVRGVNALGTSPPSNEVVLTVGSSVPLPGPPTLNGSVNQTTVSLTWTPSSTGGAPTSYVVEAGTAPGASNLFVGNVGGGTQLSATIGAGVYYVRVRGVNTAGTGPVSNEVALTVGGCGPPSPPTGLTFTASANLVTISWNASAGASEYFLQAGTAPGLSNLFNGTVGNATAISGTVGAGTYYVRLMAANSCGTSAPSSELVLTVP